MNRRIMSVLVAAFVLMLGVGGVAAADQPGSASAAHDCHGIVNAYSHASSNASDALHAVADSLGCDLSGIEPAQKHDGKPDADKPDHAGQSDSDDSDDAEEADDTNGEGGPDVAAKCAKIADKLADAEARPHGKSADAFSRQADHWECDSL